MMWNNSYAFGNGMMFGNAFGGLLTAFLIPFALWSLVWKGWALWKAVKNDSKPWFIVLLVVNTLGILDILYIFVFGKNKVVREARVAKTAKRSSRK